jgi:hypothetical protein
VLSCDGWEVLKFEVCEGGKRDKTELFGSQGVAVTCGDIRENFHRGLENVVTFS